jgi:hypothetical protein
MANKFTHTFSTNSRTPGGDTMMAGADGNAIFVEMLRDAFVRHTGITNDKTLALVVPFQ